MKLLGFPSNWCICILLREERKMSKMKGKAHRGTEEELENLTVVCKRVDDGKGGISRMTTFCGKVVENSRQSCTCPSFRVPNSDDFKHCCHCLGTYHVSDGPQCSCREIHGNLKKK